MDRHRFTGARSCRAIIFAVLAAAAGCASRGGVQGPPRETPAPTPETAATPSLAPAPPRYVPVPVQPLDDSARRQTLSSPRAVQLGEPLYPSVALQARLTGEVLVEVTIDELGGVKDARVISYTNDIFNSAALEAARRSRFEPGRIGETPIAFRWIIPFEFALEQAAPTPAGSIDSREWQKQPAAATPAVQAKDDPR